MNLLTLKAPVTTAADDIHKFFFHRFSEKIPHDVSSESHLKNEALFSSKIKMSSATIFVWRFKGSAKDALNNWAQVSRLWV